MACDLTQSRTVTSGKSGPQALPLSGLILVGPVEPLQPPRLLGQTTKKRSVSMALPGPMQWSHQPGLLSLSWCRPAAWWSPDSAWQIRIALLASALSAP